MSKRDPDLLVEDIGAAIEKIERYIAGDDLVYYYLRSTRTESDCPGNPKQGTL